ncbi:MAG: glycosyltransferase family 2 protein [Roseivirga sp.]|nr:glycosyltransferase family 2 protein [Roseivirga sp.]
METLFWISVLVIGYTFIGYAIVITILARLKKKNSIPELEDDDLPEVTLVVAAYNEADIIESKVTDCLALDYPVDKLKIFFVTDGSDDGTDQLIQQFPEVRVFHQAQRKGKIAAVNRVMPHVATEITLFTDANVMISTNGLRHMVRHFQSNLVGAVSGEKVVFSKEKDAASASGEGLYWKYESLLKRKDAEWNSLVGAAGELFAIRTNLYENVATDVIIEDFIMTMGIAMRIYKVAYEPLAIASETASANIKEETKRKIRIAAGGLQAILRMLPLLNFFRYKGLSFQYISHRVLRWTLVPIAMLSLLLTNVALLNDHVVYQVVFVAQTLFYTSSFSGYLLQNRNIRVKGFFAPYYFVFMHICVVRGWFRYLAGNQQVTWEKAKRMAMQVK